MGLRSDMRARAAARRGRARGIDPQRVRRDSQAGTTLEDFGEEFDLVGGKIRLRLGEGFQIDPGTGALVVDLDLETILPLALGAILRQSRGLKVRAEKLELVEMEPIQSLTDSSGGTVDGTLAAVSGSGADAAINNNFAELATKVNELLSALRGVDHLRE